MKRGLQAQCVVPLLTEANSKQKMAARLIQKDILYCTLQCFSSHHNYSADYCKVVKNLNSATSEASPISLHSSIPHFSLPSSSMSLNNTRSGTRSACDESDDQPTLDLLIICHLLMAYLLLLLTVCLLLPHPIHQVRIFYHIKFGFCIFSQCR